MLLKRKYTNVTVWIITFCENILYVWNGLFILSVNNLKETNESQLWTWVLVSYFRTCILQSRNDSLVLWRVQKSWRIDLGSLSTSFLSAIARSEDYKQGQINHNLKLAKVPLSFPTLVLLLCTKFSLVPAPSVLKLLVFSICILAI